MGDALIKHYMELQTLSSLEKKAWYKRLAEKGQHPHAMLISCYDFRIHAASIFGTCSLCALPIKVS